MSRVGSCMSVLDVISLGAALSLRSFARLGSSLALLDFVHVGASLSLRSFARLGSTLAVLDFLQLGSAMSLRSFGRLGSSMSLFGMSRLGASLSLLDFTTLGSSVSLRSFCRLASCMSVLDFLHLGSSLSVRSVKRLGSSLSIWSCFRMGSSLSLLDYVNLGSTLSLRSLARIGSTMSVLDYLHLGSTISLRSFARFGSEVSLAALLKFPGIENAYITYTELDNALSFFVEEKRPMSIYKVQDTPGGSLHGVWYADEFVHRSDKRLKTDIKPLTDSLLANAAQRAKRGGDTEDVASWVLRELRPVSFRFKKSSESKSSDQKSSERFGFLAQELEGPLPQIVHTGGGPTSTYGHDDIKSDIKGVNYQDLLAVLCAALQSLQKQLDALGAGSKADVELPAAQGRVLTEALPKPSDDRHSETAVGELEARMKRLELLLSTAESRRLDGIEQRLQRLEDLFMRRFSDG
eukprot:gnl/MRDRNA2_/MRDRNA2_86498_c1_seq12.p1 gnl/MRDRNA2_/MRDRNA2_86498_c1~~gnl/MRDRNA2_/MRDRNA2_86498_c1_seq12.p1  ORF type:complete len:485 (+),score=55.02 gnl/MRDRNA2_/MRDRNA2_86498_c1_seq12:64-1455(+)